LVLFFFKRCVSESLSSMSMDIIFRVHEQEYISDAVDFGTFLSDSVAERDRSFNLIGENGVRKSNANSEHFASFADIDQKSAHDVFEIIDVQKLKSTHVHYNFHVAEPTASAILPASWHKTLGFLKKEHKKKKNPQYKSVANRLLKYDRVELSLLTVPKFDHLTDCEGIECITMDRNANLLATTDEETEHNEVTAPNEIIVTSSIYYGYSRPLQYDERRLGRLMKVTDKLQLLGSSTLLDVKNAFQCPSDVSFAQDMSTILPHPQYLAKYRFPNSYFFIHDTFYVDDSVCDAEYTDLSEIVREWARDKSFIGVMKVASMSKTRLVDIKARLGMPYLYVHQGQCEHLICFTDLRLWESRDMPHSYYPIKMQEKNFRRVCCIGCKMNTAEWVIIQSDRLPLTPAFVCHNCYEEFNFTKDGHKIGYFKAVPYCDRKAMDKNTNLFTQKLLDICKDMEEKGEKKPHFLIKWEKNEEAMARVNTWEKNIKKEPVQRKKIKMEIIDGQSPPPSKMPKREEHTQENSTVPEKIITINDYDLMEL
ncbi:hypothetical protein PENTCL1PPCAC_22929, partial [Pristionchus entomophagus]